MLRRRQPDVSAFADVPLFAGYDARDLAPLAAHADRLTVMPGATLAHAGRRAHEVVVLVSGRAEVVGGHGDGRPVGPGAVIGAAEELSGRPHETTVVAAEAVAALVLTGPAFRWAALELPGFRERIPASGASAVSADPAITRAA